MKYQPGRVHIWSLVVLAVVGLVLVTLAERAKSPVRQRYFDQKMEAAQRTLIAVDAIHRAREGMGATIDVVNDPNETGLIGTEFSLVTTDRGSHAAKLRALDPNIAGVFIELLRRAGVRSGDLVAVGLTGSFPLLNAAMLASIEVLGATPVAITSVGASMWGANDPGMTWLDMESVLVDENVISRRSVAASLGGSDDGGRGLSPEGRRLLLDALDRNGVELISEGSLDENISRRMVILDREAGGRRYRAYVNVGGGLASIGSTQVGRLIDPGLSRNLGTKNFPRRGALVRMAEKGMPVIHVPNADDLIERYDLSTELAPLPDVGTGGVFLRDRYNVPLAAVLAILYGFLIFVVVRLDIKHYLFRRPSQG